VGHRARVVPRELVHKKAAREVLVVAAAMPRTDIFTVFAEWPPRHRFYHPDPAGGPDPLLFVETVRQAGILISHRYYEVPLDFRFVFQELTEFTVDDPPRANRGRLPVTVTAYCRPSVESPTRFAATMEVVLSAHGRQLGRGRVRWIAVRNATYQRIRGQKTAESGAARSLGRPLRPAEVGRRRARDVLLLDDGAAGWWLRVDKRHPYFFDHPSDHVPGMMLLEAFRQVGWRTAGNANPGSAVRLTGLSTSFQSFCELDVPVFFDSEPIPGDELSVRVRASQSGRTAATGTLIFATSRAHSLTW
jgi:2-oxo-3-(phosphooxy)propyl 3-oxoalkanoate synthase